jgi:hypothetical protein
MEGAGPELFRFSWAGPACGRPTSRRWARSSDGKDFTPKHMFCQEVGGNLDGCAEALGEDGMVVVSW